MFCTNGTLFFIQSYKIVFFLMKIKHNNGYMEKLCNKWKPLETSARYDVRCTKVLRVLHCHEFRASYRVQPTRLCHRNIFLQIHVLYGVQQFYSFIERSLKCFSTRY